MKFWKIFVLVLSLVLVCACLFACGEGQETGAPETTPEETEPDVSEPDVSEPETTVPDIIEPETTVAMQCLHTNLVTQTTETTCREDGFVVDTCIDCGERWESVIPSRHAYEKSADATTGRTVSRCTLCGICGYLVPAGESLQLSGFFGGDATFTAVSAKGESLVRFLVDGEELLVAEVGAEVTELAATELANDAHIFVFENEGETDVLIEDAGMEDKLHRRGAVLLEILPQTNRGYSSVNIYVQTSDLSEEYYVRYRMQYEFNDKRDNYASDTGTNRELYRLKTAQLVKLVEIGENAVVAEDLFEVLQSGELSLAAKEANVDPATRTEGALAALGTKTLAVDFVGGFHGDERMVSVALFADGEEVELVGRKVGEVIPCSFVTFDEITTVYAWGTSTEESVGREMMTHSQHFVFDSNGVCNRNVVEWLDDGYEVDRFYMHMFTMRRSVEGRAVCETVEILDENGNSLGEETFPLVPAGDAYYLENNDTRIVRYSSATSGVSAETGIRILEDSVTPHYIAIKVRSRETQGDNKLYVSLHSAKNGSAPEKGEIWAIEAYYHIDYMAPEVENG